MQRLGSREPPRRGLVAAVLVALLAAGAFLAWWLRPGNDAESYTGAVDGPAGVFVEDSLRRDGTGLRVPGGGG